MFKKKFIEDKPGPLAHLQKYDEEMSLKNSLAANKGTTRSAQNLDIRSQGELPAMSKGGYQSGREKASANIHNMWNV